MTFQLPWPPSVNHMWIIRGNSKRLSGAARAFRASVLASYGVRREAFDGRCEVTIALYPPDRRRMDIDNRIKAVLDALTHIGVWKDDEQVDRVIVERREVIRRGFCEVTVRGIESCAS